MGDERDVFVGLAMKFPAHGSPRIRIVQELYATYSSQGVQGYSDGGCDYSALLL